MPTVIPYCNDEDIFTEAPSDFSALIPASNVWAAGDDGVIPSGDPWLLTSALNDFVAMGIVPGMLVHFQQPIAIYSGAGEYYAISELIPGDVHSLHVRRIGAPATAGEPPGTVSGLSGVVFRVPTLLPQIVKTSRQIDAEYGIGYDTTDARTRADLSPSSLDQLRDLCVFMLLKDQYLSMATSMNEVGAGRSMMAAKSKEYADRVTNAVGKVNISYVGSYMSVTRHRVGIAYRI